MYVRAHRRLNQFSNCCKINKKNPYKITVIHVSNIFDQFRFIFMQINYLCLVDYPSGMFVYVQTGKFLIYS